MTLAIVTEDNLNSTVILNIKHVLDTNTDEVKVSTAFSKNSPDNHIIIKTNISPIRNSIGKNIKSTYEAKCLINLSNKTMKSCLTLGQELFNILKLDTLDLYNMVIRTKPSMSNPIPFEKNANTRLFVQQIIVSYIVKG